MRIYNKTGALVNREAKEFLKKLNETVFKYHANALMMAEETTIITKPENMSGLGFNYKWNMCWQKDMMKYVSLEAKYRKWNHDKLTYSIMYAFSENFILPLSHDEVVRGKRSLIEKISGEKEQKFAGLRCLYGYWMAHPGKKLIFMGGEFGQTNEWNEEKSLDWEIVEEQEKHAEMQRYSKALNRFYIENAALWQEDFEWNGFSWIEANDNENSCVSFMRKAKNAEDYLIVVSNFKPESHEKYRIGVPEKSGYVEVFNSDEIYYGGRGIKNDVEIEAEEVSWQNKRYSIEIKVPALATIYLRKLTR